MRVELRNTGTTVALANKLTLLNAKDGSRILPAYYTDNYVSLLPGESREIEIEYPAAIGKRACTIGVARMESHKTGHSRSLKFVHFFREEANLCHGSNRATGLRRSCASKKGTINAMKPGG